jgi:hypothetical protein
MRSPWSCAVAWRQGLLSLVGPKVKKVVLLSSVGVERRSDLFIRVMNVFNNLDGRVRMRTAGRG